MANILFQPILKVVTEEKIPNIRVFGMVGKLVHFSELMIVESESQVSVRGESTLCFQSIPNQNKKATRLYAI